MTVSLCIRQGSKRNDDSVSVEELDRSAERQVLISAEHLWCDFKCSHLNAVIFSSKEGVCQYFCPYNECTSHWCLVIHFWLKVCIDVWMKLQCMKNLSNLRNTKQSNFGESCKDFVRGFCVGLEMSASTEPRTSQLREWRKTVHKKSIWGHSRMCVYACFLELTWRPCFVSSACVEQRQVLCVSQKWDTEERSALHLNST